MTSLRPSALALGAILALSPAGCRTAGVGPVARDEPPATRVGATASELLADHNRNAERIQSVEASPSVSGSNRSRVIPGASARLAFDRPKSFRLKVTLPLGSDAADIGSNDDEFWFWFKDDPKQSVYYCNYDENGKSPVPLGLQPDWIIDALGLREFSAAEMSRMKVAPGQAPGTLTLTEQVANKSGGYFKEIVLTEATGRILQQRVLARDGRTEIAKTLVSDYEVHALPAEPGEPVEKVYLPKKLRLELSQEKMALNVVMKDVKLARIAESRHADLFVEPKFEGFARVSLSEQPGLARDTTPKREGRTTVRETLPAPPPRVRLAEPTPIGRRNERKPSREPSTLASALSPPAVPRGIEDVVGPPIPTVAEPGAAFIQANSGWRTSLER